MPGPEEESSIEEIEAAQRAHEEKVTADQAAAKAELEKQRELKARAGGDYEKRQDLLTELQAVDAEAKRMEAEGIKARIEQKEQLKGIKSEREQALVELGQQVEAARDRLKQIDALVAGKSEELIAPGTKEALEAARSKFQEMSSSSYRLQGEIQNIGQQIVSDEQVNRYGELMAACDSLNAQIDELSTNPALIEMLEKEAKDEHQIREEIVRTALAESRAGYQTPKSEFVRQLTETCLTEEFKARGLDAIADPAKRLAAMREFAHGYRDGVVHGDYQRIFYMEPAQQPNRWAGLLLKNLLGRHGTLGGTQGILKANELGSVGRYGRDSARREVEASALYSAVYKHLRTLNLVKAYNAGTPNNRIRGSVIGETNNWGEFDRDMRLYSLGFENQPGQPLSPKDGDPAFKADLTAEFEKNKGAAEKIAAEIEKKIAEQRAADIAELEARIKLLEEIRPQVAKAQELVDAAGYEARKKWQQAIAREDQIIAANEPLLASQQRELDEVRGLFSGGRRREIQGHIDSTENTIRQAKRRKQEAEKALADYDAAQALLQEHKSPMDVGTKLLLAKNRLEQVQRGN